MKAVYLLAAALVSLTVSLPVNAVEVTQSRQQPKDLTSWNACVHGAYKSEAVKEANSYGGRIVIEEILVDQCGPRPVITKRYGKLALSERDCAELFRYTTYGACVPEDTNVVLFFTRELDPRVFNEAKYTTWCVARQGGNNGNYRSFREQICEVSGPR